MVGKGVATVAQLFLKLCLHIVGERELEKVVITVLHMSHTVNNNKMKTIIKQAPYLALQFLPYYTSDFFVTSYDSSVSSALAARGYYYPLFMEKVAICNEENVGKRNKFKLFMLKLLCKIVTLTIDPIEGLTIHDKAVLGPSCGFYIAKCAITESTSPAQRKNKSKITIIKIRGDPEALEVKPGVLGSGAGFQQPGRAAPAAHPHAVAPHPPVPGPGCFRLCCRDWSAD
eukprot:bmy_05157T0